MAEERVRIEVGFDGGQVMGALVPIGTADELERSLGGDPDGALTLEADDGRYTVPLRRVVYLKRFAREARLGFSSG